MITRPSHTRTSIHLLGARGRARTSPANADQSSGFRPRFEPRPKPGGARVHGAARAGSAPPSTTGSRTDAAHAPTEPTSSGQRASTFAVSTMTHRCPIFHILSRGPNCRVPLQHSCLRKRGQAPPLRMAIRLNAHKVRRRHWRWCAKLSLSLTLRRVAAHPGCKSDVFRSEILKFRVGGKSACATCAQLLAHANFASFLARSDPYPETSVRSWTWGPRRTRFHGARTGRIRHGHGPAAGAATRTDEAALQQS